MASAAGPTLRQRHADRTRSALVCAALELFAERGFAATTIDQIAARADVAPRTFFRYFATKEAVVYHDAADVVSRTRDILLARPPRSRPTAACSACSPKWATSSPPTAGACC